MATLAITTEHDVQGIGYDLNGNIQALARFGADNGTVPTFGMWDRLTYTYSGNQLVNVLDMAGYPLGTEGFYGVIYNPGTQYAYDPNGNMKSDTNKGIGTIIYNHLNLPAEINFDSGNSIGYVYDALGTKLSKTVDGAGQVTTQYAGGFIYSDAGEKGMELRFFSHPEGYVEPLADGEGVRGFGFDVPGPTYSSYRYVFQYKDHLGNVRLSYSDTNLDGAIQTTGIATEIIEENNYYPFGLQHKGYNTNVSPSGNALAQQWKFGGKEYSQDLDINTYDFGARNYDPTLGRWMSIDPYADKYSPITPFAYAGNSPQRFIDPNGKEIFQVTGGVKFTEDDAKLAFAAIKSGIKNKDNGKEGEIKGIHFVSEAKTPEIYKHTLNAFKAGKSKVLHYDSDKQRQAARRRQAIKSYPSRGSEGLQRDEYPYASTFEGGEGALIAYVPKHENSSQGGSLSVLYSTLQQGDGFLVFPVPNKREPDNVPDPVTNPRDVPIPFYPILRPEPVPIFQQILNRIPVFLIIPTINTEYLLPLSNKPNFKLEMG